MTHSIKYIFKLSIPMFFICMLLSCSSDDSSTEETVTNNAAAIVEVTNITENTATITGTAQVVQGSSILGKGIAWGTNNNPTIETDFSSNEGTSPGDFTTNISDLVDNTEYHVRAYVTTEIATFYSIDQIFTTSDYCNGVNKYFGDNVFLDTQADVEAFGALGYCEVDAYIRVGTVLVDDDKITDISSLFTIKKVKGITINNTLLYNVDPLQNLITSDVISLYYNLNLVNIDGLSNINTPIRKVRVQYNPELLNIDALSGITAAEDSYNDIAVYNNEKLQNIDGLSSITIWKNGDITIGLNPTITNVDGLRGLTSLEDVNFRIESNDNLLNIDGLQNITTAEFSFIKIRGNRNLQNINGFTGLSSSLYSLIINNNSALKNLDGLTSIASVDDLNINSNESLTSIQGLSNMEIVYNLNINQNTMLTNLDGLVNLGSNFGDLTIADNTLLMDFCSLTVPLSKISIKGYYIEANAYNPTQQDIIDGNCSQ